MTKTHCKHCICLIEGENGDWICEELQKKIEDILECPEESNDIDCDHCRKCGENTCGNDTEFFRCFESV